MKKLFLSILLAIIVMAVNAQSTSSLVRVKKNNSQNTISHGTRKSAIQNQRTKVSLSQQSVNGIYRSPQAITAGEAMVTLVAGDVWGDGTGYQMLLDATASTYGSTIPVTGPLSTSGDVPASVYDQFAYKIPTNADGALNTSNIVVNDSVSITIPAGTYDFCITNPSPTEDRMWIATGTYGRQNDFVFEEGIHYIFKVTMDAIGQNDQVILTLIFEGTNLSAVETIAPSNSCGGFTSNETIKIKVQNTGTDPITGFTAKYKIGADGTPVSESVAGINLVSLAEYTYTFTTPADLSYITTLDSVQAWIELAGDVAPNDNTAPWAYCKAQQPASIPYTNNFVNASDILGWAIVDANQDGYTWGFYTEGSNVLASYEYNSSNSANDWLFSTCINFSEAGIYTLKFDYKEAESGYSESMNVFVGNAQTPEAMTTEIVRLTNITNTSFTTNYTAFEITTPGIYYIGFQATSAADQGFLDLDNISVLAGNQVGISNLKTQNTSLQVYPNPATNQLTIDNGNMKIETIELFDLTGRSMLINKVNANKTSLDISALPIGMYMLKVDGQTIKVVKN